MQGITSHVLPKTMIFTLALLLGTITVQATTQSKGSVLFVLSSSDHPFPNGDNAGWYLPEAAHPYYTLIEQGYNVVFASPKGGKAPLEPSSVELFKSDAQSIEFLNDPLTQHLVENTFKLSDVKEADYKAILYIGGHGPIFDLTDDETSIALAGEFYAKNKTVAAMCHGVAALLNVKTPSGDYLVKGRKLTSFSDAEEEQAGLVAALPFLLEDALKKQGALYEEAAPWQECVVYDRGLLTGQNPASGEELAQELLKLI